MLDYEIAPVAKMDILEALDWSIVNFGREASIRYEALIH
jgi:hypothetical protein